MQATADGGGGGGGGGDLSRAAGLARFRSAPATWLDALLEDDLTIPEDPPKPQVGLTQLLTAGAPASRSSGGFVRAGADSGLFDAGSGSGGGFHRMNSSPAEFLSGNIDGYFSSFGIPASYEYVGSSAMDVGAAVTGKRMRESDSEQNSSANFAAHRREQGAQLQTANSLLDMEMEKLLEDTVPCRVRAKRGCATHPRSIAERVRRTRISDRIRKLQELVPNMDKQTNTADMLDEAVEYVKTLQRQIHELSEQQKRCKCTAKS